MGSADFQSTSIYWNHRSLRKYLERISTAETRWTQSFCLLVISASIASLRFIGGPLWVAAGPRCAVSQNSILQNAGRFGALPSVRRPADCKSAIQQIANLRYEFGLVAHSPPE